MKIGIDLDNTITASSESVRFFRVLAHLLRSEAEIHIVTAREPGTDEAVKAELREMGIEFDFIAITANKKRYVEDNGITIFFENTDEYLLNVPEAVLVMKVREPGNFDFAAKKWIGSSKTTRMIE
ncbi:MAG: hypothetical protein IH624_14365 [Phycisphaerae bacterium]|nr:hypothetical protein [Phycisphaerae bacterium]